VNQILFQDLFNFSGAVFPAVTHTPLKGKTKELHILLIVVFLEVDLCSNINAKRGIIKHYEGWNE